MSLRKKTLLTTFVINLVLVLALYVTARLTLLRRFADLEQQWVHQSLQQVLNALASDLANLESKASDWSAWDETYAFVQDQNPAYLDNLTDATFANLNLNLMVLIDVSGKIVYARYYDEANGRQRALPSEMEADLLALRALMAQPLSGDKIRGMARIGGKPMLITALPILNSQGQGAVHGVLIWGQDLDEAYRRELAQRVHLSVSLEDYQAHRLSPEVAQAIGSLASGEASFVHIVEGHKIASYTLMKALDGQPLLLVRLETPRSLYQQGQRSLHAFLALMLAGGLIFSVFTLLVLDRVLLRRIKDLTFLANCLAQGEVNRLIPHTHLKDEIGLLAASLQKIEEHYQQIVEHAESLAQGDLTRLIQPRSEKDTLGQALARMVLAIKSVIQQVNQNATSLYTASAQLAAVATQADQATTQIAITIQQVAQGISQQSESIGLTATHVGQMARAMEGVARRAQDQAAAVAKASQFTHQMRDGIQQVSQNAQGVAEDSARSTQSASRGVKTVRETLQSMQDIHSQVALATQKIEEMGERSQRISDIAETIEDIAAQTNLLALNAAIEAARAGEHGKGFAVVADEVRKLAERASQATRQVGALVQSIQQSVAEVTSAMEQSARQVEAGMTHAQEARQALDEILASAEAVLAQARQTEQVAQKMRAASDEMVTAMDAVSGVVAENITATEQMNANSNQVAQAVESIVSVSEENSAAIEEVSASTQEVKAQVEDVTNAAAALNELAKSLQLTISAFRLDKVQASGSSSTGTQVSKEQIAGSGLIYRRNFVRERYGEDGWRRVLARLTPQASQMLNNSLSPLEKYPQAVYTQLIAAIKAEFGGANPGDLARQMARYVARAEAQGAYRFVLQGRTPEEMLEKMPLLWRLQVPLGKMSVERLGERAYALTLDHPVEAELCQNSLVGYLEGLLDLFSVRRVRVGHSECFHRGGSRCRYEVFWEV